MEQSLEKIMMKKLCLICISCAAIAQTATDENDDIRVRNQIIIKNESLSNDLVLTETGIFGWVYLLDIIPRASNAKITTSTLISGRDSSKTTHYELKWTHKKHRYIPISITHYVKNGELFKSRCHINSYYGSCKATSHHSNASFEFNLNK